MHSPISKHTLLVAAISNINVKIVWFSVQSTERLQLLKGSSSYMLLFSIAVIGPGFNLMSLTSIRINLKYDLYLFKWMLDKV